MHHRAISLVVAGFILLSASASPVSGGCLVIAHRGASGYLPEHTLPAYRLAIALGADYVEPDLVMTRDGALIARHESLLDATTDVADHPEFAARRRPGLVAGREVNGWFAEDFSLAEIRTLRARERFPQLRPGGAALNDRFPVPTFQEVLDLVREAGRETGRTLGIYPELKTPGYYRARGMDMETAVLEVLERNGLTDRDDPVILQSFEAESLQRLRPRTRVRLAQLLWRGPDDEDAVIALARPSGLEALASYVDGVGVEKHGFVIPRDPLDRLDVRRTTGFVPAAHAAGLFVHAYTFRAENAFLPADLRSDDRTAPLPGGVGDGLAELRAFVAAGVDGVFTDQPDLGREACRPAGGPAPGIAGAR